MRLENLAIDPRLEIEAFEERLRGELEQVGEAGLVTGQEREVVARILLAAGVFLKPAAGRDVGLVADHRVDTGRLRRLVKLERAVKVAVVGDREGVHPQLDRAIDESIDRARPVEQAVVAVAVEMGEMLRAHPCARWESQTL